MAVRTSKAFDGIIDFETAVCDPDHPGRLRPDYDFGDHGHLNDTGYRAMADSIDLVVCKPVDSAWPACAYLGTLERLKWRAFWRSIAIHLETNESP
jgi:hypothetical protein